MVWEMSAICKHAFTRKEMYIYASPTRMFIETLFTIAQNLSLPWCSSIVSWINKLQYIPTMENYVGMRLNELQPHTTSVNYIHMFSWNTQSLVYIIYDPICIKFKGRENKSMVSEVRTVVTLGAWAVVMTRSHHKHSSPGAGNALCLELGVSYEGELSELTKLYTYKTWFSLEMWSPYTKKWLLVIN